MAKVKHKKLTVTELLKNKEKFQVKNDVTEELYIERLDSTITIKKPVRSLCIECFQLANDPKTQDEADSFMVYNIVVEPNLKDKQLQDEFGCVKPDDIVTKLFESGEIAQIAGAGMKMAGYHSDIKVVDDLKN